MLRKKISLLSFLLVLIVTLTACGKVELYVSKTSVTLEKGSSETITVTDGEGGKTLADLTWTSDKTNIATVDESGKITAVAKGSATVTVSYKDLSATISVTVNDTAGDLAAYRSAQITVVNNYYKGSTTASDYSQENQAVIAGLKITAINQINAATTIAAVDTAVSTLKTAVNAVLTKAEANAPRIAELQAYLPTGKVEADYSAYALGRITEIKADAVVSINAATTNAAADAALAAGKLAVDAVLTTAEAQPLLDAFFATHNVILGKTDITLAVGDKALLIALEADYEELNEYAIGLNPALPLHMTELRITFDVKEFLANHGNSLKNLTADESKANGSIRLVAETDREAIVAGIAAYDALTDEAKLRMVTSDTTTTFDKHFEELIITLDVMKFLDDYGHLRNLTADADENPMLTLVTEGNREAIVAGLEAYNALTDEAKARMVTEDTTTTFGNHFTNLIVYLDVTEFLATYGNLRNLTSDAVENPMLTLVTEENREAIVAGLEAYNALTDEAKARMVTEDTTTTFGEHFNDLLAYLDSLTTT